jgi:hypothetical protein
MVVPNNEKLINKPEKYRSVAIVCGQQLALG